MHKALVTEQTSGRRASRVLVYGVDERFWRFHGVDSPADMSDRSALVSPALASDIGASVGGTVLVRLERPTDIPLESLHGRKDNRARALALNVLGIRGSADLGEFSLRPQQGDVRAVFVSLKRLQADLDLGGRVNTLLLSDRSPGLQNQASVGDALAALIRQHVSIEDLGLTVRPIESRACAGG